MQEENIHTLLSRYISHTITDDELKELRTLVNLADDEELSHFVYRMWDGYQSGEQPDRTVLDAMFDEVTKQTAHYRLRRLTDRLLRVAAILLIPLLSLLSAYLLLDRKPDDSLPDHPMMVQVDKGQRAGITLPDGTRVRLNSESQLSYSRSFGQDFRDVRLSGEAYFEVVRDSTRPFIVHTPHLNIEVLGTSFNVYSYEQEDVIEMALISGQIKVITHTTPVHAVYLKPNEKASFNKRSGKLVVEATDNRFETAWLRGALVFRSVPMKEVFQKLERRYGVVIRRHDAAIENDHFTGVFDSEHIADVMKILRRHYSFTYKIVGDEVYILSAMK